MNFRQLDYNKLKAVLVFLEHKSTRDFAGKLEHKNNVYSFTYNKRYLDSEKAIPVGRELPLTQISFESKDLFPSFADRIPQKNNPAYPDYCEEFGIDPSEDNKLILLVTIGRKGPSSFIYEPEWEESFTGKDLREFRQKYNLSTRDFAACFGLTQATIVRIENGQTSGSESLRLLEIYKMFPYVALYYIEKYAEKLHSKKKEQVIIKCMSDLMSNEEYEYSKYAANELMKNAEYSVLLKDHQIKSAIEIERGCDSESIRKAKAAFFEVRFAYKLLKSGGKIEYEKSYLEEGKSTVDFTVSKNGKKWLYELTSLSTSEHVKSNIQEDNGLETYISLSTNADKENSSESKEIIKAQNAILGKASDKNGTPIKFPIPTKNQYHVIVVNMGAFNYGVSDEIDCKIIANGINGVNLPYQVSWNGKPILGIFDENNPNPRAKIIQERIHGIIFIYEKFDMIHGNFFKYLHVEPNPKYYKSKQEMEEAKSLLLAFDDNKYLSRY